MLYTAHMSDGAVLARTLEILVVGFVLCVMLGLVLDSIWKHTRKPRTTQPRKTVANPVKTHRVTLTEDEAREFAARAEAYFTGRPRQESQSSWDNHVPVKFSAHRTVKFEDVGDVDIVTGEIID